jgi:hypothetical protein
VCPPSKSLIMTNRLIEKVHGGQKQAFWCRRISGNGPNGYSLLPNLASLNHRLHTNLAIRIEKSDPGEDTAIKQFIVRLAVITQKGIHATRLDLICGCINLRVKL